MSTQRRRRSSNSKRRMLDKYLTIKYLLVYFIFSIGLAILFNLYRDETIPLRSLAVKSVMHGSVLFVLIYVSIRIAKNMLKTKKITK